MNIYIASRYPNRERLEPIRDAIESMGHQVPTRWLDGQMDVEDPVACATVDIDDMRATELLILDTSGTSAWDTNGLYVELGYVLGLGRHQVWLVGERTNIFTYLPKIRHFENWDAALEALSVRQRKGA